MGQDSSSFAPIFCALHALPLSVCSWWLYPPSVGFYSKQPPLHSLLRPAPHSPPLPLPYSCVQRPSELLYVPRQWSHATVNEQESIGLAVELDVGGC